MANIQRVVEDEVDTEPEMDSELDDAQVEEETEEGEEKETEEGEEEDITKLLEPFSKEQLVGIILSVSTQNREIIQEIRRRADQDPSHCTLFVHGLDWETTADQLNGIFSTYGDIMQCRIVADRNTGKSKGYGFILYKHRKSVLKALKEPSKKIGNRTAICRLATNQQQQRKIFVGNVDSQISIMRLHSFFSKYGEIEEGPLGSDMNTGRFKGFALFIYKTVDGARRALEEPIKRLDGCILYCQMATDQRQKIGSAGGGGFSPYAGVNAQNGVAQPYGQGINLGAAAQPYGQGILGGAAQHYGQGILSGVDRPYGQGILRGGVQLYGQGILGGAAQPYGQGTQNVEALLAASGDGPAKRRGSG
ncbi:UBP1-associated protein 2A-like [Papaver somniferum]|uniref:UBP1-associated protein 2A-like n=1 Tax=Papaver somniferum TaxID=3469 RepID=UPI000E702293|nr:UBP1-associated protein 2A-like [Papaver somniferum]